MKENDFVKHMSRLPMCHSVLTAADNSSSDSGDDINNWADLRGSNGVCHMIGMCRRRRLNIRYFIIHCYSSTAAINTNYSTCSSRRVTY